MSPDTRLLRHARRALPSLAVCVALGVAASCCAVAQAWLLAHAVVTLSVPAALLAVFAARALLVWGQEVAAARASAGVRSRLRALLLQTMLTRPPDRPMGEAVALVVRGVDALDPYISGYLPQVASAVLVPSLVVAVLFLSDPLSAVVVLVTLPLIPFFGALVGSCAEARTRRQWRTLEVLAGHFADAVSGLATLKAFGREKTQAGEVARITDEHRKASMSTLRLAFCSALVLELAATLSVALVAVSVGLRLVSGSVSFQTALFVLILAPEAYLPLRRLGTHYHAAQEGLAAADRILALLAAPASAPALLTAPGQTPVPLAAPASTPVPSRTGRIELDGVVGRPGLAPVSLTLEPGTTTLLTGPSGVGKSTLVSVLLGLTRPCAGRVVVDGVPASIPHEWVAWLPQRPHFEPGTVAANIALAAPGAPASAVRQAAETAGVTAFTALDDTLGEDGVGLSAGQRQRVALARVVLRCQTLDIGLLLLDEPTAHLDPVTELDVRDLIANLLPGRTTLLVTHRKALHPLATHRKFVTHAAEEPVGAGLEGALVP